MRLTYVEAMSARESAEEEEATACHCSVAGILDLGSLESCLTKERTANEFDMLSYKNYWPTRREGLGTTGKL